MNIVIPSLERFLALSIIFLSLIPGARAATWFVDRGNTEGVEDGTTWATAFTTVQPAIDAASNDGGGEVWVAAGIYDEPREGTEGYGGVLLMREGVHLYGGFTGTETDRNQRDWRSQATVLTMPLRHSGTAVVLGANNATLDGFTVTRGNIGIWNPSVSPLIENCRIVDNGDPERKSVPSIGKQISEMAPLKQELEFLGGMLNSGAAVTVIRCIFSQNFSHRSGDGTGGAVTNSAGSATFVDCIFDQNSGPTEFPPKALAPIVNRNGDFIYTNCTFTRNSSSTGSVIINLLGTTTLINCTLAKNNSSQLSWNDEGSLIIVNSIIWDNDSNELVDNDEAETSVSFSIVEGGFAGEGNVDADPLFANALAGAFRLSANSPGIDIGSSAEAPTKDILGVSRPQGNGVDIGAFEFPIDSDLDGDGIADFIEGTDDLDGDQIPNQEDDDSDGDGLLDAIESTLDLDGDGLPGFLDLDSDGDSIPDSDPRNEFYVDAVNGTDTGIGTLENPWSEIGAGMAAVSQYSEIHPVTIHLAEGTYNEKVNFTPNVALLGAGPQLTRIQFFDADESEHVVVNMADGSTIMNCTVTLPGLHTSVNTLLQIAAVEAIVDNVVLDGGDNLFSIAILVSGENSSDSVIQNSTIRRVQFGIQAVDSGINIHDNVFEGIREDAIFVRLPDSKAAGTAMATPQLGMADSAGTGHNEFRSIGNSFIVNLSDTVTTAEVNDWGTFNTTDIAAKMVGDVDFLPFLDADGNPTSGSEGGGEGEGEGEGSNEGEEPGGGGCAAASPQRPDAARKPSIDFLFTCVIGLILTRCGRGRRKTA